MEKDLAKVQNMMAGLTKEGARLSEAMNTLRRSSSGAKLATALSKDQFGKNMLYSVQSPCCVPFQTTNT